MSGSWHQDTLRECRSSPCRTCQSKYDGMDSGLKTLNTSFVQEDSGASIAPLSSCTKRIATGCACLWFSTTLMINKGSPYLADKQTFASYVASITKSPSAHICNIRFCEAVCMNYNNILDWPSRLYIRATDYEGVRWVLSRVLLHHYNLTAS